MHPSRIWVSLEVVVLKLATATLSITALAVLTGVTLETTASAAPSWSDQPTWAAGNENPSPPRKASYSRDSHYNTSPFAPGSNNLALDVGQVFLMGDLSTNYADSIGSQLHYTYGVSDMFGFDSSLGYSDHSDGKFSMTTLLTGLRTNLAWYDKVVPYVVFGLGFYKPSYQVTLTQSVSPVVFGLHMGPGVDLELTRQLFFGAALTFHDIFGTTAVTTQGPLSVGGTYTTFFLHAGVTF